MRTPLFLHFNSQQQILFTRRLALYLHSGIPIARALGHLQEDVPSPSAAHIFAAIEQIIAMGLPLSQGLSTFPQIFDSFVVGFIRTGEASGTLPETLERLALHLQKRNSLRGKLRSALIYPTVVLLGTVAVSVFLAVFIFPKIIPLLQGFHTTLPLPARVLVSINSLIVQRGTVLLIISGGIILFFFFIRKNAYVRRFSESVRMRIPLIGLLYVYYSLATFTRTVSVQLTGGIRIIASIELAREALSGILYQDALIEIENRITQGQRFSTALRLYPKLFPPLVYQMVAAGEATGTLSANLSSLAVLYEDNLDELTRNLTVLVEPVLMVVMGCIVGFIALAIITPVYQITQSLSV